MEWVSDTELSSPRVLLCMKLDGNCGDEGEETCCDRGVSIDRGVSATARGGVGTGEGEVATGTDGNATAGKGADGNGADAGALGGGPDGEGSLGISGIGTLPGTSMVFRFLLPRLVTALCGVAVYESVSIDMECTMNIVNYHLKRIGNISHCGGCIA